ncbi:MAG: signal peptidase I [Flavobacteriales bacterium]|nr:signal peptidase I [Flavobacteriales bacterium]
MEIGISTFVILSILYFVASHVGLYKIFEKIGIEGWKALVPFYSTYLAVKTVKKGWLWIITYYIPFLGFVVWMGIVVELLKLLGKTSFKDHFLGVVFAGIYLPYLGFKEDVKFIGFEEAAKYKKSRKREWADAIIFAIVAATLIRGFYIEAFTIPTSSMERKLMVGDFLFVNKMAYGARVPNTPLSFPFTHHSFPEEIPLLGIPLPFGGNQSYIEWIKFPHYKLPAMGDVQRNDCVVFNFPAGDTVLIEEQAQVYEQIVRSQAVNLGKSYKEAKDLIAERYTVKVRPVDKRENYIKRCVGIPGDQLEIVDGELMINGKKAYLDEGAQFKYDVYVKDYPLSKKMLLKKEITFEFPEGQKYENGRPVFDGQGNPVLEQYWNPGGGNYYELTMTEEAKNKLVSTFANIVSVERQIEKKQEMPSVYLPVFPNDMQYNWTIDNFGPITIPKKGATVQLDMKTLPLYKRIIRNYEHNELVIKGNDIFINGENVTSYTFQQDYYWMMGDNRHNSQDSRYWGFVPDDHIVGKAVFVWFSTDSKFGTGIRWDRLFTLVH